MPCKSDEIPLMSNVSSAQDQPPKLRITADGGPDIGSLADILEWFLNYDERVSRVRLPYVEQLFQWKQQDDKVNGIAIYPFDNAEARFAVGAFQALAENDSEPTLNAWITDVLNALQEARATRTDLTDTCGLDEDHDLSAVEKAEKLTTSVEKRIYLTSSWIENLCTAEARFLGWIYQEIYGKPFTPTVIEE